MEPRGTQKTTKNEGCAPRKLGVTARCTNSVAIGGPTTTTKKEHRKTVNKCLKKGDASRTGAATEVGTGEGFPYTTAPQDNNTS